MLEKANLGDIAAENDSELQEYFLESTDAFSAAEDMKDKRCFLVGRTGAGKSAILKRIEYKYGSDQRFLVVKIQPGKEYLDAIIRTDVFNSLANQYDASQVIFKLVWHYVIMVEVLKKKYGVNGPKESWRLLIGKELKAYKFLKKAEELTRNGYTIGDLFLSLAIEIRTSVFSLKTKDKPSLVSHEGFRTLLKETESFFEAGFWDVVGGSKVYLLFDDLDEGWRPDSEPQQQLLRALFSVLTEYNHKDRVKPVVALRTNLIHGLKLPQREKFNDYILTIRWTSSQLKRMLAQRINQYYKVPVDDVHKDFFKNDISGQTILDYMIGRTLNRPRDLIAFAVDSIQEAVNQGDSFIFPRSVKRAEDKYSLERAQALHDEWKYLFPELEGFLEKLGQAMSLEEVKEGVSAKRMQDVLMSVRDEIATSPTNTLQPMWVLSYFPEGETKPISLIKVLYELGILAVNSGEDYCVGSKLEFPRVSKMSKFKVHPMFVSYVSEYSMAEDDVWD